MPVLELKSAGTRTATWSSGPYLAETAPVHFPDFTIGQEQFAELPDNSALKTVLTKTYADSNEMAAAFADVGFYVDIYVVGPTGARGAIGCDYALVDGKPLVTVHMTSDLVTVGNYWGCAKLSINYSMSR